MHTGCRPVRGDSYESGDGQAVPGEVETMQHGTARGHLQRGTAAVLLAGTVMLAGCQADVDMDGPVAETSTSVDERSAALADELEQAGLTTVASAVRQVAIGDLVETADYTLFAPDDEAFQDLTADELANLTSEPERVESVLGGHLADEAVSADDLASRSDLAMRNGETLGVTVEDGQVTVGDADVLDTIEGPDGAVIHVVDALLVTE